MKDHKLSIAAGGIVQKNGEVLLVKNTYDPNKGMWMLPGGYLDPGESLAEAAVREVKDETGLDGGPDIHVIAERSSAEELVAKLKEIPYVEDLLVCGPGAGAELID